MRKFFLISTVICLISWLIGNDIKSNGYGDINRARTELYMDKSKSEALEKDGLTKFKLGANLNFGSAVLSSVFGFATVVCHLFQKHREETQD